MLYVCLHAREVKYVLIVVCALWGEVFFSSVATLFVSGGTRRRSTSTLLRLSLVRVARDDGHNNKEGGLGVFAVVMIMCVHGNRRKQQSATAEESFYRWHCGNGG